MFKKLFARNKAPKNIGTSTNLDLEDFKLVKRFDVVLANMEDSPSYKLSHQLTVGSQIGNVVINDPSVSPRHCTFVLKDEVVSIVDHGSVAGTFVNGQKVSPGKSIILEETDLIKVGDLEVRLSLRNERVEIKKEISSEEEEVPPKVENTVDEDNTVIEKKASGKKNNFAIFQKKSAKSFKDDEFILTKVNSANTVVRIFALIGDSLIAYGLFVILNPFDEYRLFINELPTVVGDFLGIDWSGLWEVLKTDYPFLTDFSKDLSNLSIHFDFLKPTFLNFALIRLISTSLFGVSLTEGLVGIRAFGNVIWKRIGGVLRVLIGLITGPLLIFDLPAIISKRTFKEFFTFTTLTVPSKAISILGIILFIPLTVAFVLVSPLIQGFDIPESIIVSDYLDRRVRKIEENSGQDTIQEIKNNSEVLGTSISYDSNKISLLPLVSFYGQDKKISIKPEISFYHKDLKRSVRLEIYKTFNLKELLSVGLKGNFFLFDNYPSIYEFISSPVIPNSAFKAKPSEADVKRFADEVVSFTKKSFMLNFENALDFMKEETPFIKGLIDYKASFLELIEYKNFDQIDYIKIGNTQFLKISFPKQKPFDLLIPLIKSEGKIFKIQYDRPENLPAVSSKFYKFTLASSDWFFQNDQKGSADILNTLGVFDYLYKLDPKKTELDPEKSKALYGFYFERSNQVLNGNDEEELKIWKRSVDDIVKVFESLKFKVKSEVLRNEGTDQEPSLDSSLEDIQQKLIENLKSLKDALESGDKNYFQNT